MILVVSETASTWKDNGVHTAFVEQVSALRALGVELRVNDPRAVRRAELVLVHSPGPLGFLFARAAGPRAVVFAHATPDTLRDALRFEPRWRSVSTAYLRRLYCGAACVVAVSSVVRDELVSLGVDTARVHVIPLGVDAARIKSWNDTTLVERLRAAGRPGRPLVLGVGQIQPRKGIASFLAVARALPEVDFAWVGGRPFGAFQEQGGAFERALADAPPNARFHGRATDAELLAYYHVADVFLFPSRQENFGLAVLEAAAAGLPLVLSDLPVFRENFAPAATFAGDEAGLADGVHRLLEDADHRAERGRAASELASRFSARRSAETVLALKDTPQMVITRAANR